MQNTIKNNQKKMFAILVVSVFMLGVVGIEKAHAADTWPVASASGWTDATQYDNSNGWTNATRYDSNSGWTDATHYDNNNGWTDATRYNNVIFTNSIRNTANNTNTRNSLLTDLFDTYTNRSNYNRSYSLPYIKLVTTPTRQDLNISFNDRAIALENARIAATYTVQPIPTFPLYTAPQQTQVPVVRSAPVPVVAQTHIVTVQQRPVTYNYYQPPVVQPPVVQYVAPTPVAAPRVSVIQTAYTPAYDYIPVNQVPYTGSNDMAYVLTLIAVVLAAFAGLWTLRNKLVYTSHNAVHSTYEYMQENESDDTRDIQDNTQEPKLTMTHDDEGPRLSFS